AGTRIMTARGPVAVEALTIGDLLLTTGPAGDGIRPVRWIGWRSIDCTRHPAPDRVWPVRIPVGAFSPGVPARDLWLSPDHAVYVEGVLVPVKHLVDGVIIRQEPTDSVRYFHVELPYHDVLLAEGLACESYLDAGDRSNFENGGSVIRLHPDFARGLWEAGACAPLHVTGPVVERTRALLRERADRKTRRRKGRRAAK
ncbi:MAG: Hint domain-containing protein, partial [Acetobacteraceae bacterium]